MNVHLLRLAYGVPFIAALGALTWIGVRFPAVFIVLMLLTLAYVFGLGIQELRK